MYHGPIVVTLIYVLLYYLFQIHIMRVKGRLVREYKERGEKFDRYFGQDRHMLAADRIQLNMLEHMPVFLVLLWMAAVFVDPMFATVVGGIYTGARAIYPFLMGDRLGRGIPARILIATVTGYLCITAFAGALLWKMVTAG